MLLKGADILKAKVTDNLVNLHKKEVIDFQPQASLKSTL